MLLQKNGNNSEKNVKPFINCNSSFFSFFFLDKKETKSQGKHKASGRFARPFPLQSVAVIINSWTALHIVLESVMLTPP